MKLARELSELERFGPLLDALPGPSYLVGGTVRDLLLGRPPRFDFDLAVVGEAESYAQHLAERLGGRVTTHGRFGTAFGWTRRRRPSRCWLRPTRVCCPVRAFARSCSRSSRRTSPSARSPACTRSASTGPSGSSFRPGRRVSRIACAG